MAEKKDNEQVNEEAKAPEEEAPAEETAAPEAPAAEETPAAEAPAEEAPAEQAPAPEVEADEAPAEEAPVESAPAAAAAPGKEDKEPEVQVSSKERRRAKRSAHSGEARPARTPEERQAERIALRQKRAAARRNWRTKTRERRRAASSGQPTPEAPKVDGIARERQGLVVSDKADKTITVQIKNMESHRVYKKVVRSTSKLTAHDEKNEANIGDTVRVIECRPMSASKRWRLTQVVEKAR